MSGFFDRLESQLHDAARERLNPAPKATRPAADPRWWRRGLRSVPVLAAVGIVVAIALGALLLRPQTHMNTPRPGASPPSGHQSSQLLFAHLPPHAKQELGYISKATAGVLASGICQVRPPTHVIYLHREPSSALVSAVGVFRRRAVGSDRLPVMDLVDGGDVYAGYSRRALSSHGTTYFLQAIRTEPRFYVPAQRCFARQRQALFAYLPRIPAALRAPTLTLQARLIASGRHQVGSKPQDGVCLVTVHGNDSGSACGETLDRLRRGGTIQNDQGVITGVIPDGVAVVELQFRNPRGGETLTTRAPVRNNVVAVSVPARARSWPLSKVVWRSATGQVVRTIHGSKAGSAACRRNALACIALLGASVSTSSSSGVARGGPVPSSPSQVSRSTSHAPQPGG